MKKFNQKFLFSIIFLAICLSFGNLNLAVENSSNIAWEKASDWAIEELKYAQKNELIPLELKNQDLTKSITRKEFASIAVQLYKKMTGENSVPIYDNPFTDVNDKQVLEAYSLGITEGTTKTTFSPNDLVTREQMATMMKRTLEKVGIILIHEPFIDMAEFEDIATFSSWARNSICIMSYLDIIRGVDDNKFDSKGTATREQALIIALRSFDKMYFEPRTIGEKIVSIPIDLKEENIIQIQEKSDSDYFNYFVGDVKQVIEYSIELETPKGKENKIYFGYVEGDTDHILEKTKNLFIQYNGKIVDVYNYKDLGEFIDDWKKAVSIIDLDENDEYVELAIAWEGMYDSLESNKHMKIYRIINDELVCIGETMSNVLYREGNKIYDKYCFFRFIREKVEVCHYEIIDNQIKVIYEFEDGKISISNESRRSRL